MPIATITSKGQITLPKELRSRLHLENGEKIDFRINYKDGTATLVPLNRHVSDVFGILRRPQPNSPVSVEEMDNALRQKFATESE